MDAIKAAKAMMFQHTAARRRLRGHCRLIDFESFVSTHSRPKAAAGFQLSEINNGNGFNTQPPEGGCKQKMIAPPKIICFNTQPPEGGCVLTVLPSLSILMFQHTAARRRLHFPQNKRFHHRNVSTHSRPKAAASYRNRTRRPPKSFNTQPPEGGCIMPLCCNLKSCVSTHSRPKAAARANLL